MEIEKLITQLKQAIPPSVTDLQAIFEAAKPIFSQEPNVLMLNGPITICGDTHGQLEDVLHLFEIAEQQQQEQPPQPAQSIEKGIKYLFLGDYVDRGYFSVELICLLLLLKIKNPESIYLLRGNHETRAVNISYGFYDELMTKYDNNESIWKSFNNFFDNLPIAAIVNNSFFCIHGGLSPELETLDNLRQYDRFTEPDIATFIGHLLWSDPGDVDDWVRTERRSGFFFNENHCKAFLDRNSLKMIVRSHEMVDGYDMKFNGKIVTVWSAPNYCYFCGNKASYMTIDEKGDFTFKVYGPMPPARRIQPPSSVLNYFQQY